MQTESFSQENLLYSYDYEMSSKWQALQNKM